MFANDLCCLMYRHIHNIHFCFFSFLPFRRLLNINPECGSKAKKGKVTSKKTGHVVQKKNSTVNPQVSSLLRKLADFEWNFV